MKMRMLRGWCQGRSGRTEFDEDVKRMMSVQEQKNELDEDVKRMHGVCAGAEEQ